MALPQTIRVKLSSEAAGSIALTPVVIQELACHDLVDHILGLAGKDVERIQEILLRGTLVTGASRFRWQGWKAEADDIRQALTSFPDPDPSLLFSAERCVRAALRGSSRTVEIPREAAERKGVLGGLGFWDVLMAAAGSAAYSGYSYKDRADRYTREFNSAEVQDLRKTAGSLRYSVLRDMVQSTPFSRAEFYVTRA